MRAESSQKVMVNHARPSSIQLSHRKYPIKPSNTKCYHQFVNATRFRGTWITQTRPEILAAVTIFSQMRNEKY